MIKDDIFEAVREYESNNPILKLKNRFCGTLIRHGDTFEVLGLENEKFCAIPKSPVMMTYYRGEPNYYETCFPSIYRGNPSDEDIIINKLKILDFRDICKTFPSAEFAERDSLDVRYDAIAQHYGLKTDIIDITSDIAVAAFFATHEYDKNTDSYNPKISGKGILRKTIIGFTIPEFTIIGVQPFYRTAKQHAFGIVCEHGNDFAKQSAMICFKQIERMNKKINSAFCNDGLNELFPTEIIVDVAKKVINSNSITKSSIEEYCAKEHLEYGYVSNILSSNGYCVSDNPIFRLSRQQKNKLNRMAQKEPYGGIKLTARLQCYSAN